jgi:hypothetical protein
MANPKTGNSSIGHGHHGDFEPSHGHSGKYPGDIVPGGDTRHYGDKRPGSRWSDGDGANERSSVPNSKTGSGH